MPVSIEPASVALKDSIAALCETTYRAHRAAQPADWPDNFFDAFARPLTEMAFTDSNGKPLAASPTVFVALEDGALAGYIRLSHRPDDPELAPFKVDIHDICVLPKFRERGIGRQLIEHVKALATASGWDALTATVADWNTASARMFQAAGFEVKSREFRLALTDTPHDLPTQEIRPRATWLHWFWGALTALNVAAAVTVLTR